SNRRSTPAQALAEIIQVSGTRSGGRDRDHRRRRQAIATRPASLAQGGVDDPVRIGATGTLDRAEAYLHRLVASGQSHHATVPVHWRGNARLRRRQGTANTEYSCSIRARAVVPPDLRGQTYSALAVPLASKHRGPD